MLTRARKRAESSELFPIAPDRKTCLFLAATIQKSIQDYLILARLGELPADLDKTHWQKCPDNTRSWHLRTDLDDIRGIAERDDIFYITVLRS